MFGFKRKEKEEISNIDFNTMSFKDKIKYLLKSISEDDYEYDDRLKLVNKITDWYQTRYPDKFIDIYFERYGEVDNINDFVFEGTKKPNMDWNDIYNAKVFFNLLSPSLKNYISRPRYPRSIFAGKYTQEVIDLSAKGTILFAHIFEDYVGKHIKELYSDIIDKNLKNYTDGYSILIRDLKEEIPRVIKEYEDEVKAKEIMFDCVIYNLLDYWSLEHGACRALLFAEEFNRNIDIPLIYGLGFNNDNRAFFNYYLMLGGDPNLECYENYEIDNYNKVYLKDVIQNSNKYTKYEKEMYERIATVLKSSLPNDIEKRKVKQKRIERKLNRNIK